MLVVAGDEDAAAICQVVDLVPAGDGTIVHLRLLPGLVDQVHGGAGVSADTPLAEMWAACRTLRIADGPDEVHLESVARQELRQHVPGDAFAKP